MGGRGNRYGLVATIEKVQALLGKAFARLQ
jgi:hypothetical protein